MIKADSPALSSGQSSTSLLIAGGGIMGLWAAVHAERLGIDALLVDADRLGHGASGGLLGALMPHMPDKWNAKKQFQFDALVSLEAEIAALEQQTGLSAGYRRSGRLIPLPKPHLREIALGHNRDAEERWIAGERRFHWHVLDKPLQENWLDATAGESGFVHDTLAARVAPRSLTAVLAASLRNARHVRVGEHVSVDHLDLERKVAKTTAGDIAFGRCVIAAGYQSFPLLGRYNAGLVRSLGQAVKGQAALLKVDIDPSMPTIFRDGLYIIAHEGGHVAVGSTSENRFDEPFSTDGQLDTLLETAAQLVPQLEGAPVLERWAGLRPKAIDRDPMIGIHPDHDGLIALTGGFKVSFGVAHRLAAIAVDLAAGRKPRFALPDSFLFANHIRVASR
ncbi:glycine oxidase [Rhizobium mesoamericanum]|uniref:NAD(P)/FAD-dependent oxidoreductase n=1 Tax=Rhizobium mesoamericanum TaxID=1079800 RepID=UPI002787F930|nr:FAD-binding oxidoreductase [Rhizobium mesoamericanum]MDQ0561752.1 glycine oxidase [Rhizobium mesoamericanum]